MADRDDDDRALMLPPPVRKSNFYSGSSGAFRRNIISEEKYVASLEKIIERDYFPDLQEFNSRHADSEDSDVVDVTQLNVDSFLASFTTEDCRMQICRRGDRNTHGCMKTPLMAAFLVCSCYIT